jgi:hypothetical protein
MKLHISFLKGLVAMLVLVATTQVEAQDDVQNLTFKAPSGWHYADNKELSKSVKTMVIGKGEHEFPPSINLATENYQGTLKQYLKRIQEINSQQGHQWKDLGKIQTDAGSLSLSQVDSKTKWGQVRMMHVIFLKDETIYIMTAASLKEEFPKFYKDFFTAFKSLKFENNPANDVVTN